MHSTPLVLSTAKTREIADLARALPDVYAMGVAMCVSTHVCQYPMTLAEKGERVISAGRPMAANWLGRY